MDAKASADDMKAISLWQPWASAVVLGIKTIETRGWSTNYRGRLAIHAAKLWKPEQQLFAATEHALGRLPKRIPLGCIVGYVDLVDCRPTELEEASALERILGNFAPGRYAWILAFPVQLDEPVPFRGKQGFFSVPDALIWATHYNTNREMT